jgi:dTMP kinase
VTEGPSNGAAPALAPPVVSAGGHGEPGTFVVLEGIDGSGRSTHARLLEQHLRYRGIGVIRTSLATSRLAADPIRRAKRARAAGAAATALLYAADIAERMELVVRPSLRAGLVVLADRYVWTPMARAEARGVDPAWLDAVFSFAMPPDLVLLLDVDPEVSLARRAADPDPYEAGADLGLAPDLRESYRLFQERLAALLARHARRAGFTKVPANDPPGTVEPRLELVVDGILDRPRRRAAEIRG